MPIHPFQLGLLGPTAIVAAGVVASQGWTWREAAVRFGAALLLGAVALIAPRLMRGRAAPFALPERALRAHARGDGARPERLGAYALSEKIGEGGMGVVYRAERGRLRDPVALKLLNADGDEARRARFEREVQILSRLRHPNIVSVRDFGSTGGVVYCAMELLDGLDLQRLVDSSGPQDPRRVAHILLQVCNALVEAHEAGLVHRDIKPANLFLCRDGRAGANADTVKVLDFGLAKDLNASDLHLTSAGAVLGTPGNMAPECFTAPEAVGPLADLYALGTVAYTLLAGSPVFRGKTLAELAMHQLYSTPASVRLQAPQVSVELSALVMSCLAKSPAERPASVRAVREALLACPEAQRWTHGDAASWWARHEAGSAARPSDACAIDQDTELTGSSGELAPAFSDGSATLVSLVAASVTDAAASGHRSSIGAEPSPSRAMPASGVRACVRQRLTRAQAGDRSSSVFFAVHAWAAANSPSSHEDFARAEEIFPQPRLRAVPACPSART